MSSFSSELLEKAKTKLGLSKDAQLLELIPNMDKGNLSKVKNGARALTEEQAMVLAERCNLDAEWVLVSLAAETTKSDSAKKVWSNLAKKLLSHGLAAVLLITSGLLSVPEMGKHVFLRRSRYIA